MLEEADRNPSGIVPKGAKRATPIMFRGGMVPRPVGLAPSWMVPTRRFSGLARLALAALALAGVLVLAALSAETASAQTCWPEPDVCGDPPEVTIDQSRIEVDETSGGSIRVTNGGTYTEPGGFTVSLTASRGVISKDDNGNWSWHDDVPSDGPWQETVRITADNGAKHSTSSFVVNVRNVAPTGNYVAPSVVRSPIYDEYIRGELRDPTDASAADRAHGYAYEVQCKAGDVWVPYQFNTANPFQWACRNDGSIGQNIQVVGLRIKDKDGGVTEYHAEVRKDRQPPATIITTKPSSPTADPNATFVVESDEPLRGYQFSLNGSWWDSEFRAGDTLTVSFQDLPQWNHCFRVWAIDLAGNFTDGGAEYCWFVDREAPNTIIHQGPNHFPGAYTNADPVTFFAQSSDDWWIHNTFECRMDNGPWAACLPTRMDVVEYPGLAEGQHTFEVRATDPVGHTDPTPAAHTFVVDRTAPEVTNKAPDTTGVALDASVEASFSEPLNASTATAETFTLTEQGASAQIPAAVTVSPDGSKATLDPSADLTRNTTYTATVKGGGVKDRAGNPLAGDVAWSFTMGDGPDVTAPHVRLTSPADGATVGGSVPLSAEATDDRAVDRVEFIVNGSLLAADATRPYAVNWNSTAVDGGTVTVAARAFDASGQYTPSATHTVTVDNQNPTVTTVTPAAMAKRVAPNANVNAFFSESMKATTVNASTVKLYRKGSVRALAAVVTYDATTKKAVLNPNANLRLGTTYKATVTAGTTDAAGNPLDQAPTTTGNEPKTWFFTVRR